MNVRSGRPEPVDVVVGAGQAGLAVSYYLQAFGVEHVVLERGRVGESWRSARWDSFTGIAVPRRVAHPPFWRLTAPVAWSTITLTLHADGSSEARLIDASPFPRHFLYDSAGRLTYKSALLRYHDWIRESGRHATPWDMEAGPVPVAPVNTEGEQSLANSILVSGDYRQHRLPAGALLSEAPLAGTEVHLLLDGLLVIEIDHQPAAEAGPGAIFDPVLRTQDSKDHVTVRAQTPCRLAVVPRSGLDSQALLGATAAQKSRLRALRGAAQEGARS